MLVTLATLHKQKGEAILCVHAHEGVPRIAVWTPDTHIMCLWLNIDGFIVCVISL